jgi:hypothetical protein
MIKIINILISEIYEQIESFYSYLLSISVFLLNFSNAFHNAEILSTTILSHDKKTSCIVVLWMYINYKMFEIF